MIARRDERFAQRLGEQIGQDTLAHERELAARLAASGMDPIEIAAAAIRLARAGESSLPEEEVRQPEAWAEERKTFSKAPRDWKKGRHTVEDKGAEGRARPARSMGRQEPGMIRLWMNMGGSHGLRPSDVVGAIASEVGIPGRAIGEISIQYDHTFVDVHEKHVGQVLKKSKGKYFLRGMPVLLRLAN
jgi:ATP-dependent RNA helicase DeaD